MPFWRKDKLEPRENWALVLNPVRSEVAKTRLIDRMMQVFPLDFEEASGVAENTPIILLEGLSRDTCENLRDYFRDTGANLLLTEDGGLKRRCFRAVWPSIPNLDFLTTSKPEVFQSQATLKESLPGTSVQLEPHPESDSAPVAVQDFGTARHSEDRWRDAELEEFDRTTETAIESEKRDGDREIEQFRGRITSLEKENAELKTARTSLEQESKRLNSNIEALSVDLMKLEAERSELLRRLKQDETGSKEELERLRTEAGNALEAKTRENETLRVQLGESQVAYRTLVQRFEEARKKHDQDFEQLNVQSRELQSQLEVAQRQVREFASVNEQQELIDKRNRVAIQILEKEAQLKEFSVRAEVLEAQLNSQKEDLQSLHSKREVLEKEVLKDKQTQKYLLEQLRAKDKNKAAERLSQKGGRLSGRSE